MKVRRLLECMSNRENFLVLIDRAHDVNRRRERDRGDRRRRGSGRASGIGSRRYDRWSAAASSGAAAASSVLRNREARRHDDRWRAGDVRHGCVLTRRENHVVLLEQIPPLFAQLGASPLSVYVISGGKELRGAECIRPG